MDGILSNFSIVKGLGTYESVKADIEQKVKRDERSDLGQKAFIAKLMTDYKYTENTENVNEDSEVAGQKDAC